MAISAQRYVEIEDSLQRIQAYLAALAAELDEPATVTNRQKDTHEVALTAVAWVAQLRHVLQAEQEQQADKGPL